MLLAERLLKLRTTDGDRPVAVRLFAPERQIGVDWACRYSIDRPHGERAFKAHGVDAMQALMVAFQMIGVEIYTSPYHRDGHLFFEKPGSGYGFPLPRGLQDMAVGDDAAQG